MREDRRRGVGIIGQVSKQLYEQQYWENKCVWWCVASEIVMLFVFVIAEMTSCLLCGPDCISAADASGVIYTGVEKSVLAS